MASCINISHSLNRAQPDHLIVNQLVQVKMCYKTFILLSLLHIALAEMTVPGIDRTLSEGVSSLDFNVVYGDEDMTIINQIVNKMENSEYVKSKISLNEAIAPLPPEDVKCLMSVDKFCSKDMLEIKGFLIQAIKNECNDCPTEKKERTGKVVAAMLAHDPVAWKLFLTRSALHMLPERKPIKKEKIRFRVTGEPEILEPTKDRFLVHGVSVKVKRYATEIID